MKISYGPPGERGVQTIMGLGDVFPAPPEVPPVATYAALATVGATLLGMRSAALFGAYAFVGAVAYRALRKKAESAGEPQAVAGW